MVDAVGDHRSWSWPSPRLRLRPRPRSCPRRPRSWLSSHVQNRGHVHGRHPWPMSWSRWPRPRSWPMSWSGPWPCLCPKRRSQAEAEADAVAEVVAEVTAVVLANVVARAQPMPAAVVVGRRHGSNLTNAPWSRQRPQPKLSKWPAYCDRKSRVEIVAGDETLLPVAVVIPLPPRRDHRSAISWM